MKVIEFGSEFDWDSNVPFQTITGQQYFDECNLQKFRSGRDALKAVAIGFQNQTSTVLLPALCCESMVSPFVLNGYKVVFYKINEDYTADVDDVEKKLEQGCLLLYMSYFGVKPFAVLCLQRWKEQKACVLIEDRTQNALHKMEQQEFTPDVIISSIRKWIALPDGGLLWSKKYFKDNTKSELSFTQQRFEAMRKKSAYLSDGLEEVKTAYRQMLQWSAEKLDEDADAYTISSQSDDMLKRMDFRRILLARQRNVETLKEMLNDCTLQNKVKYVTEKPEESALYFPILVEKRDELQKALAKKNIYCPVIWPIPQEAQGICEVAEYTANHMLALPCDQRYTTDDMKYIAEVVQSLLSESIKVKS